MIDRDFIAEVFEDTTKGLAGTALRQILIAVSAVCLTRYAPSDATIQMITAAVVLSITIAYGLYRKYYDNKKALLLAKSYPSMVKVIAK